MSENLKEEAITVDPTEALSDSIDEELVKLQEIPVSSNIIAGENQTKKLEKVTEGIDKNAENVPLKNDYVTEAKTQIGKLPLQKHIITESSSALREAPQNQDLTESLKESIAKPVQKEKDLSCIATKESISSPRTSTFSLATSIVENHDKEMCPAVLGTPENKDLSGSIFKDDSIISCTKSSLKMENEDNVIDISYVAIKEEVIDSPLKTSSENLVQKIIEETSDKETLSESIIKISATVSPSKRSSEIEKKENVEKDSSEAPISAINPSSKDPYAEHVTYTEDGSAIYTDPQTKYQYKWCSKENNWIPSDANSTTTNPYENEHYKWCSKTEKWMPKNTQITETEHYKWDAEKNEWIAKVKDSTSAELTNPTEVKHEIDKDGQRTYTDKDGTVFFWDVEKNAWFPKIDDDFMARYQMSYGFIDNTSASLREKEELELTNKLLKEQELERLVEEAKANDEAANDKKGLKRKAQQEPPKWFDVDPAQNTKVYVTNLPLDITLDEFADVMGKCGMIMRDPQTQKYKLKLYTEADGQVKGDGLCDYIKVESVDLALKILDEYEIRGHKMRVQRAKFQMRGEYNPALKPKRKKKDKEKLAKIKEKLFDWRPEKMRGERSKNEKTVIIKNLFHPELFEKEVQLILDYQTDLREECGKCGTVRKVVVYDRHSEGVAQVNMSSPEEADLVIQMMQGRFFGKRQLTAEHWDGKTKYKVEETEDDIQKRLNKWDQYLETEENKKSDIQNQVQLGEYNKSTDLQKQEPSSEEHNNSEIQRQEQSSEEYEKSDLLRDEQDIEKTINFENNEV